jgi:lysophospholipase L1-like esterase
MKPALALLQGAWLYASRPRLQEPTGPREGTLGTGPALRLLILGDSAAAGVGVPTQQTALAGHLTRALATDHTLHWRLAARCGATTATTHARLTALPPDPYDAVLIAVGINDAKNGVPRDAFLTTYRAILTTLRTRHSAQAILCTALPPVLKFPTVPEPLRSVMGRRAQQFDTALQDLCAAEGTTYLPHDAPPERRMLAADGLHPGAPYYEIWARAANAHIRAGLA